MPVGAGSLWPTSCSKRHTNYVCQLPHIILFWGKKSEEGKQARKGGLLFWGGEGRKEGRKERRKGCCSGVEEGRYPTLNDKKNVPTEITKGP